MGLFTFLFSLTDVYCERTCTLLDDPPVVEVFVAELGLIWYSLLPLKALDKSSKLPPETEFYLPIPKLEELP